jgi:hypothetical protein
LFIVSGLKCTAMFTAWVSVWQTRTSRATRARVGDSETTKICLNAIDKFQNRPQAGFVVLSRIQVFRFFGREMKLDFGAVILFWINFKKSMSYPPVCKLIILIGDDLEFPFIKRETQLDTLWWHAFTTCFLTEWVLINWIF